MKTRISLFAPCLAFALAANADIRVGDTVVLGPFTGHHAALDPANAGVEYYGTDLGWTYVHDGRLQFLFGDTWKNERGEPLTSTHDDVFGSLDLTQWRDARKIDAASIPRVRFGMTPNGKSLAPIDYGLPAEGLKTPVGGFSNGEREFAVFITGKPQACGKDADCGAGFTCETSVGFLGERPGSANGLTLACEEGSAACNADTLVTRNGTAIPNTGVCADPTSSMWTPSPSGRTSASTMEHWVAIRDPKAPAKYQRITNWHTNKFINVALRTVDDFDPARGAGRRNQDYRNAATASGPKRRVFLWGRPEFIGVNAARQTLAMYFAYADLPSSSDPKWRLHYFSGTASDGSALFSTSERDAVAVDLDATRKGVQSGEQHDIVQHMSIVWIEHLGKWVMFYGGGINDVPSPPLAPTCGLLEIFARTECKRVVIGNGALRMRVADDPWGPWSTPQDVFVAGAATNRPTDQQYGPGGVLHHPACVGERCQSRSPSLPSGDYGWLYGANIIEPWIIADANGVDVIWNASTWNPYRVILLKTHLSSTDATSGR